MEHNEISQNTLSRNQMHEKLMICAYQYLFYLTINEKQELNELIENTFNMPVCDCDPFVKKALFTMIVNLPEIVITIQPLLKDWKFERLGLIEQAILVLGYSEFKYLEMPKAVVINIAVKLAKKYAEPQSFKFINGVLERAQ